MEIVSYYIMKRVYGGMAILYINGKRLRQMFEASARWLIVNEEVLNELNVFPVPDGDTGTNMGSTLKSIISAIRLPGSSDNLSDVAGSAAGAALLGARGNSGVILSQIIQGFAEGIKGKTRLNSIDLAIALKRSYEKAWQSVSNPKEGTILTVLRESVFAAYEKAKTEPDIIIVVDTLLCEARVSLANTPNLLPVLKEAGVVDAGAMGFVMILEGIEHLMKGGTLPELSDIKVKESLKIANPLNLLTENYGYCTEFFINTGNIGLEALRTQLLQMGDSLVLAQSDEVVKVHIHTLHPGAILETCLAYGILTRIKIENMDTQHSEREAALVKKPVAFVAVTLGEGVRKIFRSMGCDTVIKGGQTMNPSVEEMARTVRSLKAEHIILLPNNGNVLFSAEQLCTVLPDINIHVVPTKTIPEGFAALMAWNQESSIEENLRDMNLAIRRVKTGEVTRAVRDTTINTSEIRKGDIIAITDHRVLGAYSDFISASSSLIRVMADKNSTIVTLLYSEDIEECIAAKLEQNLQMEFPEFEIEVHHGGQPYISIIISVE
ncbi:MAG: DAK2 domain-containing protein [Ruminiclostridium sp.]|nr:DAK2 domain-containing protein [Ruminiclostridium sp.]